MCVVRSLAKPSREERGRFATNLPWSNGFRSIDESKWWRNNSVRWESGAMIPIASGPMSSNLAVGGILRDFETAEPFSKKTAKGCNPRFRSRPGSCSASLQPQSQPRQSRCRTDCLPAAIGAAWSSREKENPGGVDSDGARAPRDQIVHAYSFLERNIRAEKCCSFFAPLNLGLKSNLSLFKGLWFFFVIFRRKVTNKPKIWRKLASMAWRNAEKE